MNIFLVVFVIMIVLIGMVFKYLASGDEQGNHNQGSPVKIDFIFFNSDGLKCRDGQVVNCNLIIHGFSNETFSRELIHEEYMRALQKFAVEKNPDWFFSEKKKCHQEFLAEFEKMSWPIKVDSLEIAELSYADECFTDKDVAGQYEEELTEVCKKEVEERIADLEQQRDMEERKCEEERDAAVRKAEEEMTAAIAKVEEETRLMEEKLEREFQQAIKREEDLNRKNNSES